MEGALAWMEHMKDVCIIFVRKHKTQFRDLGTDRRIILTLILEK
jgi:hypothetical protein